jgi:hypothetical protein
MRANIHMLLRRSCVGRDTSHNSKFTFSETLLLPTAYHMYI